MSFNILLGNLLTTPLFYQALKINILNCFSKALFDAGK